MHTCMHLTLTPIQSFVGSYTYIAVPVHAGWQALQHVYARSIDPGEVRPELNHASNAAAVVGRRELTKGGSLERRVFLPS